MTENGKNTLKKKYFTSFKHFFSKVGHCKTETPSAYIP